MGSENRLNAYAGDDTDAPGERPSPSPSPPRPPRTTVSQRLGRRGAILPGRSVDESFSRGLLLSALLGGAAGALVGIVLGAGSLGGSGGGGLGDGGGGDGGGGPWAAALFGGMLGGLFGALVGAFVGLVSGFGAVTAVFVAVSTGATARWVKASAGAIGANLGVLVIGGIATGNGYPGFSTGIWVGGPPLDVVVAAVASGIAALTIVILDSEPRRATALAVDEIIAGPRSGGPPTPPRRGESAGAERATDAAGTVDTDVADPERARLLRRAQHLRGVAVVLGFFSVVSPMWMLLAPGMSAGYTVSALGEGANVWRVIQVAIAAAIPAVALGCAVASGVLAVALRRSAAGRPGRPGRFGRPGRLGEPVTAAGAELAETIDAPWGIAVLAACTLALTLGAGAAFLNTITDARASYDEQQRLLQYPTSEYPAAPPIVPAPLEAGDEVTPEVLATHLSASELQRDMQALVGVAAAAAGPTAVWTVAGGANGISGGTPDGAIAPITAIAPVACLSGTGVSYPFPQVSFTTGIITDTSTDEHDREVTDSNVAAAERIVAAWKALGYGEDSGLGGNIDLWGSAELAATSMHIRYSFGLVTLVADSHCVAPG